MTVMVKASIALLAVCAAVLVQDQASTARATADGTTRETAHLSVKTAASADAVAAGRKVSLFVDVTPKPKMHVYAPGQAGYIAINLALDPNPAFTAAKAKYPAGEKLLIAILNETQLVYAKPFRIAQDVTVAALPESAARGGADAAALTIKGTLRYQACDDRICYLPTNVPVEWTLKLAPGR